MKSDTIEQNFDGCGCTIAMGLKYNHETNHIDVFMSENDKDMQISLDIDEAIAFAKGLQQAIDKANEFVLNTSQVTEETKND